MPQAIIAEPADREEWWLTRSFRVLLAQLLLLLIGAAGVALAAVPVYAIAFLPWPDGTAPLRLRWLGYLGLGSLGLLLLVASSYGFMLGRRMWTLKAGKIEASASGDEESADLTATGQAG